MTDVFKSELEEFNVIESHVSRIYEEKNIYVLHRTINGLKIIVSQPPDVLLQIYIIKFQFEPVLHCLSVLIV